MITFSERDSIREQWRLSSRHATDIRKRTKVIFSSAHVVGSEEWKLVVRRHIFGGAKSLSELIPAKEHINLQASRSKFVVFNYWSRAHCDDLSPKTVKGCDEKTGYSLSGIIVLEREEDLKAIAKEMSELVARCRCKGKCLNKQ